MAEGEERCPKSKVGWKKRKAKMGKAQSGVSAVPALQKGPYQCALPLLVSGTVLPPHLHQPRRPVGPITCGPGAIAARNLHAATTTAAAVNARVAVVIAGLGTVSTIAVARTPATAARAATSAVGPLRTFTRITHHPSVASVAHTLAARRLVLRAWTTSARAGK